MNDIAIVDEGRNTSNDQMMLEIIKSGSVESLERYIALKEREESRQAAIEFDAKFAEMQKEFSVIYKSKDARDSNNRVMYTYAPLETLQMELGPIIAKHGFSYTFSEESIQGGKRCSMRISGHGASRTNSFDVPQIATNARTNAVQASGSASSYGRRYCFIAGFGVIISGEDDDAQTERDPVALIAPTQTLKDCKDAEALKSAWATVYTKHKGDSYEIKQLTAVYNEMKGKLL